MITANVVLNSQEEPKMRKHEIERAKGPIWKKVNRDVKQACLLWLSIILSETEGINYAADANQPALSLSVSLRRCSNLGAASQSAAPQPEPVWRLQTLAALCWPCAHRARLCPPRRIPLFLSLPAFPAATSATICAGSRTAEDMFFTLLIYGADSRRKLPRLSPSQPQIGEYRCS